MASTTIYAAVPRAVYYVTMLFRATRLLGPPRLRHFIVPAQTPPTSTPTARPLPTPTATTTRPTLATGAQGHVPVPARPRRCLPVRPRRRRWLARPQAPGRQPARARERDPAAPSSTLCPSMSCPVP
ncbi:hypothetical protein GQ55_1G041000 [Panicum hallii var. hallii]|uniref:Uncharacterized protein n=2 Tax=Panicum hallii TaxID=206008 RepID=A0A2T7F234_9POAL|nr:hypothetical protein GQ55_1G041000 [Panicum hallii var. hallii]PVH65628.1 hypothetical protein PAHAL_1G041800 [Panicum hallii]